MVDSSVGFQAVLGRGSLGSATTTQGLLESLQLRLTQYTAKLALLTSSFSAASSELEASCQNCVHLKGDVVQSFTQFSASYQLASQRFFKNKGEVAVSNP
ncbi:MAG: hypothetical protein HXX20_09535 [Chloroflexi bacterium]|nr:hypothetical protein [Chloroflexota bacterium]